MERNNLNEFFGNPEAIFAKNNGRPVRKLDEHGTKCALVLNNLIMELINKNFNQANSVINDSFIIREDLLSQFKSDISSVMFYVKRNEMSYKDFIGFAYESIIHENYILFYAMINLIKYKLNTAQRMFFDDKYCLKDILEKINEKIDLNYPINHESTEFKLFYDQCIREYYPIGNVLKTKNDYLKKQASKYSTSLQLNLDWVNEDFESCVEEGSMREFIIEIDNYINTLGNEDKYDAMWNYLTDALLYDFLHSPLSWNEELSKSIIMSMIGYSECYDRKNILEYSVSIRNFILSKLTTIQKIILFLPMSRKVDYPANKSLIEISIFLINLYHVFPFRELLEFINDKIIDAIESSVNYNDQDKAILENIKNHIKELEDSGIKNRNKGIKLAQDVPLTSKISEVFVYQQVDDPKFTSIYIGINLAKATIAKIELKFFDDNGEEIILGKDQSDSFIIDLGYDCPNGGYVGYFIPILNCSSINLVKAKIINGPKQEMFISDSNNDIKRETQQPLSDKNSNSKKQEGCYIATAVYGDYNSPEVIILRNFRDNYLLNYKWGTALVRLYYRYSPSIAEKLKNRVVLNSIIKKVLDIFINIKRY